MKLEKRKGLVRGVVTVQQNYFEPIIAYTMWFRHDTPELEKKLQKAIDLILNAYRKMNDYGYHGAVVGVEWMDYLKG